MVGFQHLLDQRTNSLEFYSECDYSEQVFVVEHVDLLMG
jgi:hypothetical protein